MTKRRPRPVRTGPKFEPCVNCVNGWEKWVDGFSMRRCACWKAHQEKLERLERGQQEQE